MTSRSAVIFGATGQDGYYLSKFLLAKQYKIYCVARRASGDNASRLRGEILDNPYTSLLIGDVTDSASVNRIILDIKPDEVYNLAAQSDVGISFKQPGYTLDSILKGTLNVLEAIKLLSPKSRYYQASSSEQFGESMTKFQDEATSMNPVSPYGVAKLAAHKLTQIYRKSYGLHASCGILFNHESPMRSIGFFTRKVTDYVAQLKLGITKGNLLLGNLDSCRDIGFAGDYVQAMHLIMQQIIPDDYVVATGNTISMRTFLEKAFIYINKNCDDYVIIDKSLLRPWDVPYLRGCANKANSVLGWKSNTTVDRLVELMVEHDIRRPRL